MRHSTWPLRVPPTHAPSEGPAGRRRRRQRGGRPRSDPRRRRRAVGRRHGARLAGGGARHPRRDVSLRASRQPHAALAQRIGRPVLRGGHRRGPSRRRAPARRQVLLALRGRADRRDLRGHRCDARAAARRRPARPGAGRALHRRHRGVPAAVELPAPRRRGQRQELPRLRRDAHRTAVRVAGAGRAAAGRHLVAGSGPPRPGRPAKRVDEGQAGRGAGLLSRARAGGQRRAGPGARRGARPQQGSTACPCTARV